MASSRLQPIRIRPGPMAKYVADAAILLGVLEGATPDPNDAASPCARVRQAKITHVRFGRTA